MYLDTKKLAFPRFYFLSNDELLEILSETKDPVNVQPFVKKCFEAVQSLVFDGDGMITGCVSIEGEQIPFDKKVDPTGESNGVEAWLLSTERVLMGSLHSITQSALQAYPAAKREDWLLAWPGQVVLAVSQIFWTRAVEEALRLRGADGVRAFAQACSAALQSEVALVRGELTPLQRATLGALVVVDVHARDMLVEMAGQRVRDASDFAWQAQLRYYWEEDTVLVRMLNAVARYGYEYLGNSGRLVITPLTDRCYRCARWPGPACVLAARCQCGLAVRLLMMTWSHAGRALTSALVAPAWSEAWQQVYVAAGRSWVRTT